jgi:hypothetical protein
MEVPPPVEGARLPHFRSLPWLTSTASPHVAPFLAADNRPMGRSCSRPSKSSSGGCSAAVWHALRGNPLRRPPSASGSSGGAACRLREHRAQHVPEEEERVDDGNRGEAQERNRCAYARTQFGRRRRGLDRPKGRIRSGPRVCVSQAGAVAHRHRGPQRRLQRVWLSCRGRSRRCSQHSRTGCAARSAERRAR